MKFLYNSVQWNQVQAVGFDLDGTLYNEHDFISQVYQSISLELGAYCAHDANEIFHWMDKRWLDKGSSYPYIYSEVLDQFGCTGDHHEAIKRCLKIYRNFKPQLVLNQDIREWLEELKREYPIFIVTDGNAKLQASKYLALGLDQWFKQENVGFTGYYGTDFYKPSIKIMDHMQLLHEVNAQHVVFFGDRDVDQQFADAAGFMFIKVKCMQPEV
jgi:FMN phosphatase YigB (HAD superfamily)